MSGETESSVVDLDPRLRHRHPECVDATTVADAVGHHVPQYCGVADHCSPSALANASARAKAAATTWSSTVPMTSISWSWIESAGRRSQMMVA